MKIAAIGRNFNLGGAEKMQLIAIKSLPNENLSIEAIYLEGKGKLYSQFVSQSVKFPERGTGKIRGLFWVFLNLFKTSNKSDLIFSMQDGLPAYISILVGIISRKPVILWNHTIWSERLQGLSYYNTFMTKILYPFLSGVISVSESAKADVHVYAGNRTLSECIMNPVDIELTKELSNVECVMPSRPYFLTVSRLISIKNIDTIIRSFAISSVKSTHKLLIIGDGEERPSLEGLVNELGLNNEVDFLGSIENPYSYIKHCDALICASKFEGFGIIAIEGMILDAKVIISCSSGGHSDLIKRYRMSNIFEPADYNALSIIIDNHANLNIGYEGFSTEDFDIDSFNARTIEFFKKTIGRSK